MEEKHYILFCYDGMETQIWPKHGESLKELQNRYVNTWIKWGEEEHDVSRVQRVVEMTHSEYLDRYNR